MKLWTSIETIHRTTARSRWHNITKLLDMHPGFHLRDHEKSEIVKQSEGFRRNFVLLFCSNCSHRQSGANGSNADLKKTMTSLAFDTTHIALDRAKEFDRHHSPRPIAAIQWIATHGSRFFVHCIAIAARPLRNRLARAIESDTKRVLEFGALLDGVRIRVEAWKAEEYIDADDEFAKTLELACARLERDIEGAHAAAAAVHRLMPEARLLGIIRKNIQATQSALLSATNLKWSAMEKDADLAIQKGDMSAFMSADDLIADLLR